MWAILEILRILRKSNKENFIRWNFILPFKISLSNHHVTIMVGYINNTLASKQKTRFIAADIFQKHSLIVVCPKYIQGQDN
jgi:hypothetical protein